jgi:hypothetical protein
MFVKVLGYGEDFLTFWAINRKLDEILGQLNDDTDPEECTVFYRPSFGRRAGTKRAEFGEFDAIITTPKTTYLVESKWDGSNASFPNNVLKLGDIQICRHEIFRWYHENWKGESWKEFVQKHDEEFRKKFYKNIAPVNSLLSKNLMTVLKQTQDKELIDVLLFFHTKKPPKIETSFKEVTLKYKLADGEYTELI